MRSRILFFLLGLCITSSAMADYGPYMLRHGEYWVIADISGSSFLTGVVNVDFIEEITTYGEFHTIAWPGVLDTFPIDATGGGSYDLVSCDDMSWEGSTDVIMSHSNTKYSYYWECEFTETGSDGSWATDHEGYIKVQKWDAQGEMICLAPYKYENGYCVPDLTCACDELKDEANNTCTPMSPETTWVPGQNIYYTHPDNNHDDAERCSKPAPETESYGSCASNSNTPSTKRPINCATGQKHYTEVDYQGFGLDALSYSRYYETPEIIDEDTSLLTTSWSDNNTPSLSTEVHEDGAISKIFRIGNKVERIFFFPAGSTTYEINSALKSISLGDSNTSVTIHTGKKYEFNGGGGTVSNIANAQGQSEAAYTASDVNGEYLITRQTNRFGRYLDYTYNADGLLITLTDQDGVTVNYEYDTLDNLVKVIYPDGTPTDLTDNPSKEYLFENTDFPSYVTGIVDQDGARLATIAYSDDGKAFSSELADGTDRVEVTYPTDSTSIVKFYRDVSLDAYREEQYTFNKFRGQYKLTSKEIIVCDNCELTTETWDYDSNELLIRHTSPAGTVTEYSYDDQYRRISESIGVGTPEVRTTTYTWNDTHNQIETITTATDLTTYTFDVDGNRTNTLTTPVQ